MQYKDYYQILGVSRQASTDEIKRSYRKLARKYHPDVSKETNAEERFKDVQEAYEVLKDDNKRSAYDQLGSNWKSGQEFHPPPNWEGFNYAGNGFEDVDLGGFSDFFSNIFGARRAGGRAQGFQRRGRDEYAKIGISLEEAYQGGSRTVQLQLDGTAPRTLKINIPAGIMTGQQLRLANQGAPGINAPSGDLFLEVEILPHRFFTLQGKDVYLSLPVTPWEAALGAKMAVPTLGGSVEMKIAPGSQAGQKLRLKGRGMPGKPSAGDQYVLLQIVTPPAHSPEQRALYEQMAKIMPFDPRQGLF